jgi:hypothetical protein
VIEYEKLTRGEQNGVVISAMRMALTGAADDKTKLQALEALLAKAPPSNPRDTEPVRLFVDTLRDLDARVGENV